MNALNSNPVNLNWQFRKHPGECKSICSSDAGWEYLIEQIANVNNLSPAGIDILIAAAEASTAFSHSDPNQWKNKLEINNARASLRQAFIDLAPPGAIEKAQSL